MTYLKFKEKRDAFSEDKDSFWLKLLVKVLSLIIPSANPDFDSLYGFVETWYIEYDEQEEKDGTIREVGRDSYGRIIVKDPDDRNYGYWTDVNGGINDYIEKMNAEYITQEEFESVWNEELVKVNIKDYARS